MSKLFDILGASSLFGKGITACVTRTLANTYTKSLTEEERNAVDKYIPAKFQCLYK